MQTGVSQHRAFALMTIIHLKTNDFENAERIKTYALLANPNFPISRMTEESLLVCLHGSQPELVCQKANF